MKSYFLSVFQLRSLVSFGFMLAFIEKSHAHHPMGGVTPDNFLNGLLSGLAHPILGWDHLVFLVALAILAAFRGQVLMVSLLSIGAFLSGVLLHIGGFALPAIEAWVSLSIVGIGVVIALWIKTASKPLIVFLSLAGVLHGYALGEPVAAAESTPIVAYLAGLAIIQIILIVGAATIMRTAWFTAAVGSHRFAPMAGTFVLIVGLVSGLKSLS